MLFKHGYTKGIQDYIIQIMERDVNLRLTPDKAYDETRLRKALGIGKDEKFIIIRRSIDARRRDIFIDLTCRIDPQKPIDE